jgi:hypothetical protein
VSDLRQLNTMVLSASSSARASLAADRRTLGVARSQVRSLTAEVGAPNSTPPACAGRPSSRPGRRRPPPRPGSTPTRPGTTRACCGTTAASACPRAGRPAPAAQGDRRRGRHRPRLHPQRARPRVKQVIDFTGLKEEPPVARSGTTTWPTSSVARPTPTGTATAAGSAAVSPPPSTARASTVSPQGQLGRAQDLGVVRLGQRRGAPGRVPEGRRPGAGRRQHLLRGLHRHLHARGRADLPGLHRRRPLRPQQGHDHRRLGRQRARPGRRRRPGPEPWPAHQPRDRPGGFRRPVGHGRDARWSARRGRCGRHQPGGRALLGQLPAGHRRRPGRPRRRPACPPDYNATCKPASDPHQAAGQGRQNQLAYYSDYGPRIDIAGPGGARKFNLPCGTGAAPPGSPTPSTT